jgi:RNA polymerase sigma-70 factor (ECF subfamily)
MTTTTRLRQLPTALCGDHSLADDAGLREARKAYGGYLLRVARRVVNDPHLAEEAVQEAFVRAWRASAQFDPHSGPMLPWLVAITRNAAIDMVRARNRRPPVATLNGARTEPATASHEDVVVLRDELSSALATLPADHRAVVVETVLRGRPHADVAAELGIPSGTVRSRRHYALRRLREAIEASRAWQPLPA